MNVRFLLLVGGGDAPPIPDNNLLDAGLRCAVSCGVASLWLSPEAHVIPVHGRGMVIGELFNARGEAVTRLEPADSMADGLGTHLLQHYWGEYVALSIECGEAGSAAMLLRDPSGGVPCVYSLSNGHGFVTSDISIAVDLGLYRRGLDWQSIAHGLHFPYRGAERTGLLGINELLPGCELGIGPSGTSIRNAWSPWRFVQGDLRRRDPESAGRSVRDAVTMVVNAYAAIDDRFIVQLSGGLDSSIVAASLRGSSTHPLFGSLVMPVAGTDERPYAKLVTEASQVQLMSVPVGLEDVRIDFPIPRSSVVPATGMLQHATSVAWDRIGAMNGTSTFYTGGGGDSIFCYLKTAVPAADAYLERGIAAASKAVNDLSTLHGCTIWKAGRLAHRKLRMARRGMRRVWKEDRSLLSGKALELQELPHPWLEVPAGSLPGDNERIQDLIGTQLYMHATLAPNRRVRRPLLSQPVMEACLKVPTWMWIAGGRDRAIARDAFKGIVPDAILARRSKGSYAGYLASAYSRNKPKIREFLMDGELRAAGLLDPQALSEFFSSELASPMMSFVRAFDLCAAENWVRNQA